MFLEGVYFVVMGAGTTSSYRWTCFVKKKLLKILSLYHSLPCDNINKCEVCLVRCWKFENTVSIFRVEGSVRILCRLADARYREGQSLFVFLIIKRVVSLVSVLN